MRRWLILAGLALASAWGPLAPASSPSGPSVPEEAPATAPTDLEALVAEGQRWWTRSPDPGNPMACATCHFDPEATRGWSASFPKFKPLPPPHARVMTLLQAVAEALERHYRLRHPLPAATAITAYLTWQGAGVPISPGASPGQPVLPARMEALAASVRRGERRFGGQCASCHDPSRAAAAVTRFPRVVGGRPESLEAFLEDHQPAADRLRWGGGEVADLMAYLTARLVGRPSARAANPARRHTPCCAHPSPPV